MLLIPLPKASSRGDQILNAENFKKNGYANSILQEQLNIENLNKKIEETLKNKKSYIEAMKNTIIANGNDTIINLIKETSK